MRYLEQLNSERQKRTVVARGCSGGQNRESVFNGHRVSVWEDEKVLESKSETGSRAGGGDGESAFHGAEVQFGKMRKFWRRTVEMAVRPCESA